MLKHFFSACLVALSLFASTSHAATDAAQPKKMTAEEFLASLHFQHGKITLPGDIATLDLPSNFRYLPPDDAERVLVDAWGNPPGPKSLGMIFPESVGPLSENGWGVIITYAKDGYVKDDDADKIDYKDLLKDMQKGLEEANADRIKQGYGSMTLVGWADAPYYDKNTNKMYWAKELKTGEQQGNTLNYNVRVLGRHGVLVLNAVAGMSQKTEIKREMQKVQNFTDFTAGNRYVDYDAKTDKLAEYGIAALVAGGVASKLGLFGKLFAFLLAFKKLIIVGIAALGGAVMKLFGRKSD
ncbi:MAG: DUF2167 domain-containing protein [Burkholderiales bacterium]|nr:DUF2167 domain-containing protein [Burkholderiales bacterium]